MLVRPLGVLTQLLATDFELRRIGRIVQGVTVLAIAVAISGTHLTWQTSVLLVTTPIAGAVVFASVLVIGGSVAFWWIDSGEFANGFTYGGRDFATYPITVYGQRVPAPVRVRSRSSRSSRTTRRSRSCTCPTRSACRPGSGWTSPLVAAAIAGIAAAIWRTGVRHYRSTGS